MSQTGLLELAKEHQVKRFLGRYSSQNGLGKTKRGYKLATCIECKKQMDVPDFEVNPFYCYHCNEEAECALR